MYDELIKRLRSSAEGLGSCDECNGECNGLCIFVEAADAIEELSKKYLDSEVDNTNLTGWLAEEHAKHMWIPVTERLPQENGFYLCLYKHKHSGGVAMDEGLSIQQWYNGRWNLNEIYAVTHWLPLPELPKEE